LLNQIDDEQERKAFVDLYAKLPEPDSIPVHLSLSNDTSSEMSKDESGKPNETGNVQSPTSTTKTTESVANLSPLGSTRKSSMPNKPLPLIPPSSKERKSTASSPEPPIKPQETASTDSPTKEFKSLDISNTTVDSQIDSFRKTRSDIDYDPPIKEGYLMKKTDTGLIKIWQRRYFLLKRDQLLYFVDREGREKGLTLGIIPLKSVQKIQPTVQKKV
jgi:hypothetical protein